MRTLTRVAADGILTAHDFSGYRTVADVGGGTGALLASVLRANPGLRGILCDRPHVLDRSGPVIDDVRDRVDVVAGDFFASAPSGADCYLLRRILHDWPDAECRTILARIREVLPPDGRLLVLDAVVGPPNTDPETAFLDLMMLVSNGGRERTEPQWAALLGGAGFRIVGMTRATPNLQVIELAADDQPATTGR
jgi:SAM-dependent methyltransferase